MVNPQNRWFTMQYDADGRKATYLAGDTVTVHQYDPASRQTTQAMSNGGGSVMQFGDTWDAGSRKTRQTRDGNPVTYLYDNANRLTGQQKAGAWATFVYDPVGNILVKDQQGSLIQTMSYDAASRLTSMIVGATEYTFGYDNNGSMTAENTNVAVPLFAYDRENRLKKRTETDGTVMTNTYDGNGLRWTRQKHGENAVTYIWDGSDYLGEVNS